MFRACVSTIYFFQLFLLELSQHTQDERERKAMQYLCSKEGSAMFSQHVLNKKQSFVDILKTFQSCKPPIGVILAHSTRLLPRPYSIINFMKTAENELKICFSVTLLDNNKKGLTTGWLEKLLKNSTDIEIALEKLSLTKSNIEENVHKIPIYLRKNMGFSLPECPELPLLLICAGTGLAPFLGFLEERQHLKENKGLNIGDTWLFFGCRNPDVDFLYKEELQRFKEKGVLTQLSMAFSRINNGGIKYVQVRIH